MVNGCIYIGLLPEALYSVSASHTHTLSHTNGSKLPWRVLAQPSEAFWGFSALLKDASTCDLEEPGIAGESPILLLVYNPLYL